MSNDEILEAELAQAKNIVAVSLCVESWLMREALKQNVDERVERDREFSTGERDPLPDERGE